MCRPTRIAWTFRHRAAAQLDFLNMANKEIVFADRVVGMSVHNGLVRMDLAVIAGAAKGKDDKPAVRMEVTHQIVLPLDAFVAGVNAQQNLIKEIAARQKQASEASNLEPSAIAP